MKNKNVIMLFAVVIASTLTVNAQQAVSTMGLKDVLAYGLKNSIAIQQTVLDKEQAEYKVGEVRSSGLPQIDAEGKFQNFPNLPTQLLPGEIVGQPGTQIPVQFGTEYTTSGTINASQLLYSQEFFTGLRAARSSRELYEMLKIQSEEDVIYEVSKAFYKVLELQAQIEVVDSNMAMLTKLETLMKAQYENDVVTKTDYSRVKVNRANLATNLQSLKTGIEQQTNYLKLLIGMPIQNEIVLQEPEGLEDVTLSSLQYEKLEPIELKILERQKALNVLNRKATNAGYVPTLALFGSQQWQAQRNEFNFFDSDELWFQQTVWGLQLNVPIFDGLSKHYKSQQNKIDIDKLSLQQINAERQLDMQYKNAREQLTNSLASVEVQKENKELAREVYDQTQMLYKEQVSGLTDLLDAEQAFREAQNNYYSEILKFKTSELDLLKSQGQLQSLIN